MPGERVGEHSCLLFMKLRIGKRKLCIGLAEELLRHVGRHFSDGIKLLLGVHDNNVEVLHISRCRRPLSTFKDESLNFFRNATRDIKCSAR